MRYLFGLLNILASAVVAFAAFIIGAMSCDESCIDDVGVSWYYRESAWQWDAIIVFGCLQLAAAAVLYLFVILRRRRIYFTFLGLQAVSACVLVLLLAGAEMGYSDDAFIAAGPALLGALAVWVTRFPVPRDP